MPKYSDFELDIQQTNNDTIDVVVFGMSRNIECVPKSDIQQCLDFD